MHLLVDTSIVIKWLHAEGEADLEPARRLRAAHVSGGVDVHMIDLACYEIGNVLTRGLRWPAADVADQLDDLHVLVGPLLTLSHGARRRSAELAQGHGLTFYDASWVAAAQELGMSLVSADRDLLSAGLAETVGSACARLRLQH